MLLTGRALRSLAAEGEIQVCSVGVVAYWRYRVVA